MCHEGHSRAGVLVLGADRLDPNGVSVEDDAVRFRRNPADRLHVAADGRLRAIALAQEIEIPRSSVGLIRLEAKEHGALEHEALASFGLSKSVEETLETEAREERLIDVAALSRPMEQARGDGGGQVALAATHAIASM